MLLNLSFFTLNSIQIVPLKYRNSMVVTCNKITFCWSSFSVENHQKIK